MKTGRLGLVLVAALVLAVAETAGASSTAAPHWQKLPVKYNAEGGFFRTIGWASGRFWFEAGENPFLVWSARIQSGRLTSFVSTPESEAIAIDSGLGALGQARLLFCCNRRSDGSKGSLEAPLLANGKVGTPQPIPGDPELIAQQKVAPPTALAGTATSTAQSEITIGNRTIWAITGRYCPSASSGRCTQAGNGGVTTFALCCTASGDAVDLSSLLGNRTKAVAAALPRFAVDTHKRLWLGWAEAASGNPAGPSTLHLDQIDPATLTVRAAKTLRTVVFPVDPPTMTVQIACSDSCRLVWTNPGGVYSWGGDGAPTQVVARAKAQIVAAGPVAYKGGGLETGYIAPKSAQGADYGTRVTIVRGDARGRNARVVTSADVPPGKYSTNSLEELSAFTPAGVVAVVGYMDKPSYLLAAVLQG